jgi:hypothetical protein
MNKYSICDYCVHNYEPKSISFIELLKQYDKILIPKIQRDYAQGRSDKKSTDVRNNFLDDLFNNENGLKLDFIFGTTEVREDENKKEYCFIPLDGQQRLTTLFLLHLYGCKTGVYNYGGGDLLKKFSYDTRRAAKDFCASIIEHWVIKDNSQIENDVLSKRIMNSTWFMDYWQYDPTVSSMLTMLDAIHVKTQKCKEHYPKLDEIKFHFFDMDAHNLSESLYLKMNARGKPLTAFENFKSAIETILPTDIDCSMFKMLNDTNLDNLNDFQSKWKYCIDRKWAEFFWQYKDESFSILKWFNSPTLGSETNNKVHLIPRGLPRGYSFDGLFMRLLCNSMSAYWVSKVKAKTIDDAGNTILGNEGLPVTEKQLTEDNTLKELTSITGNENFIPFSLFDKIFQLDGAFQYFAKLLCNLVTFKDVIIENSKPGWKKEKEEKEEKEEYDIIKKILTNPTYGDRVILYAISVFSDSNYDLKIEQFKKWMRVVWNIVENSTIDSSGTFLSAIRLIDTLAEGADDIYTWLKFTSKKRLESLGSRYHAQEQVEEEKEKAIKILNDQSWEEKIIEAEKFAFFNGAIRFLFTDEAESESPNWDRFDAKFKKAQEYFDKDGVMELHKKDAILFRSLICHFTDWGQFWGITYDHKASSWKDILTRKNLICPVNKILTNIDSETLNIESQLMDLDVNWGEKQKSVHEDLYQTNLLSLITEGCVLNFRHKQYALYPPNTRKQDKIYVIGNKRNKILSHFLKSASISCENRVNEHCDFFWSWDINFEYNGNNFLWNTDEQIYYVNQERERIKDNSGNDISISTENIDENNFLTKLDELVGS